MGLEACVHPLPSYLHSLLETCLYTLPSHVCLQVSLITLKTSECTNIIVYRQTVNFAVFSEDHDNNTISECIHVFFNKILSPNTGIL